MTYQPFGCGYDRWEAKYWVAEMESYGIKMEEVIQGAKTFSNPMKELEADLKEKKLNYNNNPVTKWCLLNTSIEVDKNENIRPIKRKEQERTYRWYSIYAKCLCGVF